MVQLDIRRPLDANANPAVLGRIVTLCLFVLGLLLRLAGLLFYGMHDIDQIILEWGAAVYQGGLGHVAIRTYGLFSYIFHGLSFALAEWMPRFWWAPHKFFEMLFGIGIFILLWQLLPVRSRGLALLLYWVNPLFIVHGAWQGFWDAPYVFLALLSLFCLRAIRDRRFAWAASGACLFGSALFKPQGLLYFVMPVTIYLAFTFLRNRRLDLFWFGAGAGSVLVLASLFLRLQGNSPLEAVRGFLLADVMPNLCNSCVGIWRPVAKLAMDMLGQSGPLYDLRFPGSTGQRLDRAILATVLILILWFAWRLVTRAGPALRRLWSSAGAISDTAPYAGLSSYLVMTFAALVIPQLGTRAHINHTYAALVLLILFVAANHRAIWPWGLMVFGQLYVELASYQLGRASVLPTRNISGYPEPARQLVASLGGNTLDPLLQVQSSLNHVLGSTLVLDPASLLLGVLQFISVLWLMRAMFVYSNPFNFGKLAALMDLDPAPARRAGK